MSGVIAQSVPGFIIYNDILYFAGLSQQSFQYELWRSDGTTDGTYVLKDGKNSGFSTPTNFVVFNGYLYFSAHDNAHGTELWRTDGTESGTQLTEDIYSGKASSSPTDFVVVGCDLFFIGFNSTGSHLFYLACDTYSVTQVEGVPDNATFANLVNMGNNLYFIDFTNNLWRTDGSTCHTQKFDFIPGDDNTQFIINTDGNELFFSMNDPGSENLVIWNYITTPITSYEVCNGIDDDCDRIIDDNTVAVIYPDSGISVCKGDFVTLTANSGMNLNYQWFKNGKIINGATNITFSPVKSANYSVLISSSACSDTSASANVSILSLPSVSIMPQGSLEMRLSVNKKAQPESPNCALADHCSDQLFLPSRSNSCTSTSVTYFLSPFLSL